MRASRRAAAAAESGRVEEGAEVAPVRFGSDGVTGEQCDDDDEQEPAHEPQRRRPRGTARSGSRDRRTHRSVSRSPRARGGFAFSAMVMMIGISTMTAERDAGTRSAPLLDHLGTEQPQHQSVRSCSSRPRNASSRRWRDVDGVDPDAGLDERGDQLARAMPSRSTREARALGARTQRTPGWALEERSCALDVVDLEVRRRACRGELGDGARSRSAGRGP